MSRPGPDGCILWMGNCDRDWTQDRILSFFREENHHPTKAEQPSTGNYAFITFESPEAARDCKQDLDGKRMPSGDAFWRLNVRTDSRGKGKGKGDGFGKGGFGKDGGFGKGGGWGRGRSWSRSRSRSWSRGRGGSPGRYDRGSPYRGGSPPRGQGPGSYRSRSPPGGRNWSPGGEGRGRGPSQSPPSPYNQRSDDRRSEPGRPAEDRWGGSQADSRSSRSRSPSKERKHKKERKKERKKRRHSETDGSERAGVSAGVDAAPGGIPSAPAPAAAAAVEKEEEWIHVTLCLGDVDKDGNPSAVPGEVPVGVTVGGLLGDFLDEQQQRHAFGGEGGLGGGGPEAQAEAEKRRLVGAVVDGRFVGCGFQLANKHAGAVVGPIFAGEPEGRALVLRSLALLGAQAAREALGPQRLKAVKLTRHPAPDSCLLELLGPGPGFRAANPPGRGLGTAASSASKGAESTGWGGDDPGKHPSCVPAPLQPVGGVGLAASVEARMKLMASEERAFVTKETRPKLAPGGAAGEDAPAAPCAGLRLGWCSNLTSIPHTTLAPPQAQASPNGGNGAASNPAAPEAASWGGEPFFGVTVETAKEVGEFHCEDGPEPGTVLVVLGKRGHHRAQNREPSAAREVHGVAKHEASAAHGLDCAAAVNVRLARLPSAAARKAVAGLVEAMAMAKLRRTADNLVAGAVQVVLVGGPVGSGCRGAAEVLSQCMAACAMPTLVLHTAHFLKPTSELPSRGGWSTVEPEQPDESGAFSSNSGGLALVEALSSAKCQVDSGALAAAVAQALGGAQTTGLRCLIIQGLHALNAQAVNLEQLGLAHMPSARVLATPLVPTRLTDLGLLQPSDLRLLRCLAFVAHHDDAPPSPAASPAAGAAPGAALGTALGTAAAASSLGGGLVFGMAAAGLRASEMASRVLKAGRAWPEVEADHFESLRDVPGLVVVEGGCPFEANLLKPKVEGLLRAVPWKSPESATARRLLELLEKLDPLMESEVLPGDGILARTVAGHCAL